MTFVTERFETRQWVPFPVEQVFAFFAVPANLPRLMPARMQTRIDAMRLTAPPELPATSEALFRNVDGGISSAAGAGSEIQVSFCPFSWSKKRVNWTAKVIDFEWNSYIRDEQVRGPFREFQHRHGITVESRYGRVGTLISDDIQYVMPYGFFGQLGDGFVQKMLTRSFEERQKQLPGLLALDSAMNRVFTTD
jgi:ligand-binding SRPBCC domain-containing protein